MGIGGSRSYFLDPLLVVMENALQGTTYDYAIATMTTNSGSSPIRILLSFVPVALAFVYRKYLEYQDSRSLDVCVNMAVLNFVLNTVATFTSGLYVIRLATYLVPYNAILYSFLLEKCFSGSNKKLIKALFYMLYFAFYWYQMSYQGAWGYNSDIIGSFS